MSDIVRRLTNLIEVSENECEREFYAELRAEIERLQIRIELLVRGGSVSDVSLWLKHPWAFSEMEAKTMKDQMLRLLDEKDAEIERLRASVCEHAHARTLEGEIERLCAERNLLREMFNSAERELAAERERCAKIAEAWDGTAIGPRFVASDIAAAIRRGEP